MHGVGSVAGAWTQGTFSTAAQTISSSSILVQTIVLANADASNSYTVTATDADGNTIVVFRVAANSTLIFDDDFVCQGLTLTSSGADADLTYTVFHSATAI